MEAKVENSRVVLLLHGMNSGTDAWDSFLGDIGASAPNIIKGVLARTAQPRREVRYYAVKFGAFDASSGRVGLDGVKADSSTSGDFSSLTALGKEVQLAVEGVLNRHPGAEILLVGHSRGGLAGRAFLQKIGSNGLKASVIGYLSLGAPHRGSHLARVHPYLTTHSRFDDPATWNFADVSRNFIGLDVRRPTVKDLAVGSPALDRLNRRVSRLPVDGIKYRTYLYTGLPLGQVSDDINIFDTEPFGISSNARQHMLKGHTPKFLDGDGTVHSKLQRFDQLARVRNSLNVRLTRVGGGIAHIDEPERTDDILRGMRSVVEWSFRPVAN